MSLQEAYESDEELVALIDKHGAAGSGYLEPASFSRMQQFHATGTVKYSRTPIQGLGAQGAVSADVAEQLFALSDSPEKTITIALKDRATVMVAEWVETQPPNAGEFDEKRKTFFDELTRNRSREVITEWLDPDNIRARSGFALITN